MASDLEQDGGSNPARLDAMTFGRLVEALASAGFTAQRRGGGVAVGAESGGTPIFYQRAELAQYLRYLRKIARHAGADTA